MKTDMEIRTAEAGFSLLETIAAFAVISIVLVAATQSVTASISLLNAAGQIGRAGEVAESVFAEALARTETSSIPQAGVLENGMNWSLESFPVGRLGAASGFVLYRMVLTVSDQKSGRKVKTFSTYQTFALP